MVNGSAIRNRDQKAQLVDFGGLRWGKIMPTDIDAMIDFGNKLFVFIEAKYGGAKPSFGQRLALERVCDAVHSPENKRYAVAFLCAHSSNGDIDLSETIITEVRWFGKWHKPKSEGVTLKTGIDTFKLKVAA